MENENDNLLNIKKQDNKDDHNSIIYILTNIMKDDDVNEQVIQLFNDLKCYKNQYFLKESLKIFNYDTHSLAKFISELLVFRNNYYPINSSIEESLIESVIKTNLVALKGYSKKGYPTIVIKAKNSCPKIGTVEEKVSYIFFIFENLLKYCIEKNLYKICIIYDRGDYDKDLHFDHEMAEKMKTHKFTKMYNFLTEFVDIICIMNLNFIYRMMIKMYRLVNNDKNLDKLVVTSSKNDLLEYWNKEELIDEFKG